MKRERSEPPQRVVPPAPPPVASDAVAVTSVTIRLNGHGGFTGTVKGISQRSGGVYVHGSGASVSDVWRGLLTAIEKGRWLRDKYPD